MKGACRPARHDEIYLQLAMCLRAIIAQRLIPSIDGKRVAAVEILRDTPYVKDLIKSGQVDKVKEGIQNGTSSGCQTFDQDLLRLYSEGRIDHAQALANGDRPNDLRLCMQHANPVVKSEQPELKESGAEPETSVPPLEQWLLQEAVKQKHETNGAVKRPIARV